MSWDKSRIVRGSSDIRLFTIFNEDNTKSLQVDCGVRLQGGHSRLPEKSPKHSFRLVFKSKYGPPKLNYPFFEDDAVTSFNTLSLKAGFENTWIHHEHNGRYRAQYQRDTWTRDAQRAMGHIGAHTTYVHLYINGLYWGLYSISERIDREFAASYCAV